MQTDCSCFMDSTRDDDNWEPDAPIQAVPTACITADSVATSAAPVSVTFTCWDAANPLALECKSWKRYNRWHVLLPSFNGMRAYLGGSRSRAHVASAVVFYMHVALHGLQEDLQQCLNEYLSLFPDAAFRVAPAGELRPASDPPVACACEEDIEIVTKRLVEACNALDIHNVRELLTLLPAPIPIKEHCYKIAGELVDRNLVEMVCCTHGCVISSPSKSTALMLSYKDYSSPGEPGAIELLTAVITARPDLITEKAFEFARGRRSTALVAVMLEHDIQDTSDMEICYICHGGREPENLLRHVCACKIPIHHRCWAKVLDTSGSRVCTVCRTPFHLPEARYRMDWVDERAYSPCDDYYPMPLFNDQYRPCTSLAAKVDAALIFLQCDRLQQVLNSATDAEIEKYMSQPPSFLFRYIDSAKRIIKMGESMPSNYLRDNNEEWYTKCEEIVCARWQACKEI
jgi:hypothetical protein